MKAVVITKPGDPSVLKLEEVQNPEIKPNEILIKVSATAINRADTLQRLGAHPPPPGSSPFPGLECSGVVEAVGSSVTRWKIGDQRQGAYPPPPGASPFPGLEFSGVVEAVGSSVTRWKIGDQGYVAHQDWREMDTIFFPLASHPICVCHIFRGDTIQRQGAYPPPPGVSPFAGLECSGVVESVSSSVVCWEVADQVCALLSGGGYAEKVAVPAGQVLPVPDGVSVVDAASFPEVACTVWSTVFMMSRLSPGETFLIHGGSSGIGTFAIQIAKYKGIKVFVTAGSEEKLAACKELGADVCINYKTEDFVSRVKEETQGKGVDVILDNVGGPYFQLNLESLNVDGRLFIIGFMGGAATQANLAIMLGRRLTVQAAGLRGRSLENKAEIVSEVEKNVWPAIAAGKVKPVVYKHFPLSEAAEGHRLMETSTHIGKILLIP